MIEKAEERVWAVANGGQDPGHQRPEPEVLFGHPAADIETELASFSVPHGMQVNLFASEADGLTNPLAIRWDTAGRAYVTVTTTWIASSSTPLVKAPRLLDAPLEEVVAALGAPERWTRYQAKRELTRRRHASERDREPPWAKGEERRSKSSS